MAEPAAQRLAQSVEVARRDIGEGRGAGAAVEIFVAAADGEIGVRGTQIDRQSAGAVTEVPDDQRTGSMGARGQRPHVEFGAGAVVDLGDEHRGNVSADRVGQSLSRRQPDFVPLPHQCGEATGDVDVSGEIALLGDDDLAIGPQSNRDRQKLEDIDRGRIRHDHRSGRGADQGRDLVPDAARQVDPVVRIPAGDEVAAPLLRNHTGSPLDHRIRQRAKRIAVEIDDAVR